MKQKIRIVVAIILIVQTLLFTVLFNYNHALHDFVSHAYYLTIIVITLWFRKWTWPIIFVLLTTHLLFDFLTMGYIPQHTLNGSLVQLLVALTLFLVLRKREAITQKHQQLLDEMQLGLALHEIILDEQGKPIDYRFLQVNPMFETTTGLKASHIIGKTVLEVFPQTEQSWIDTYGKVALTGEIIQYRNFSKALNKWFEVRVYSPIRLQFVTLFLDITEQVKLEEQAKEQEKQLYLENQRFSLLVGSTSDIIFEMDTNKRFTSIYGKGLEKLHITPEQVIGKRLEDVFDKDKDQVRNKAYDKALQGHEVTYEWEHEDQGIITYFHASSAPIFNENNQVIGIVGVTRDITDIKKMQIAIEENHHRLENIIEATQVGTWEWHITSGEMIYNRRWAEMLGYTLEELSPTTINTWKSLVHPEDVAKSEECLQDVFQLKQNHYEIELRMKHKNGSWVWILDKGKVMMWSNHNKPILMSGTHTDITKIKENEEMIRSSREILRHILDTIPVRVFWKDIDLNYIGCNDLFAQDNNLSSPDDVIGLNDFDLVSEEAALMYRKDDIKIITSKKPEYDYIDEFTNKKGEKQWLKASKIPLFDSNNQIIGLLGVYEDITEQRIIQEDLEKSEARYRSIIAVSNTGAWEYYRDIQYAWCSPEYFTMLGYDANQFPMDKKANIQDVWMALIHPDDRELAINKFDDYLSKHPKTIYENHFRLRRKDGTYAWIWARGQTLVDKNGKPTNLTIGAHIDVTHIKEVELALALEKRQIETTLFSIGDGVISTDAQGSIVIINDAASRLTGWTLREAKGKPFDEIFHIDNEDPDIVLESPIDQVLKTKQSVELGTHTRLISKDHSVYFIEYTASPVMDENGYITGVVLVFRDVTEKNQHQREIEYLNKYDYLTGVYNRRYFESEMQALDFEKHFPLGIMFLDLNGLKLINDAFGHEQGDIALQQTAKVIQKSCRRTDVVARMGGDEFAVLLPNTTEEACERIKNTIGKEIAKVRIEEVSISVAIGYEIKTNLAIALHDIFQSAENHMYRRKLVEGKSMRNSAIRSILNTLTVKYEIEKVHSERVSLFAKKIGEAMGLKDDDVKELTLAGLVHDIGKISIADRILQKQSKLTPEEYAVIKTHTETGYQILRAADEYSNLAEYALSHHERFDGTGYPNQLKGLDIPLFSRIICVADAYEAMTSNRPYRKSLSNETAIDELKRHRGTQFDPEIVDVLIERVINKEK